MSKVEQLFLAIDLIGYPCKWQLKVQLLKTESERRKI